MQRSFDETVELAGTVVATARDEEVTFLAAAVAYYAFVSLVPLLILVVAVASAVGGEAFAERVVSVTDRFITPEAQTLVREALTAERGRGPATVIGVTGLLWGGLKVFRGLDRAFTAVYATDDETSFLDELRDAAVALGAIGVGLLAVAAVEGAVRAALGPLWGWTAVAVLVVTLVVALFPLYLLFPPVEVHPRGALPGAVTAALGWTVLESAFRLYVALAGASLYGVLGAALILVTWLYLGALVVILGAIVNVALADRATLPDRTRAITGPE